MKTFVIATLLCSMLLISACTARELATGAAAGTAGYVIGREDADD